MSTPSTKLCVLISGNGSNLQAIIDNISAEKLDAEICGVISNRPNAYGLTRAQEAGIKAISLDHMQHDSRESYDKALQAEIESLNPDYIVLAGFMRILTPEFVNTFSGKLVNIHPSLLPKYKGLNTHQQAIDNGDEEHGVSVHFVTPELDGGPVIIQSRVPVFEDDTAVDLADRVQEQERRIYPLVLSWFSAGRLKMVNNKAILDEQELPESGYANE
ncbi:phosphoribosylglycinamide formyltransferase [Alteromonas stellipolaris]|uniref:Phosphoribosylglycinamide formyltransferase n=1 Tax=Alteromonas stellipolaris TaxID=233316 RepID=A0AAW7YXK9_9ALTE|nr:phosphoribosylglycinamide formyltransferase [Alteromonas stellipolaris]ALM90695.1 Phosphoribosylglycinamide formyltransferase [Alteromonas stellipolaris LMG 21856]AMJ73754.1 phosphoribosylglycinamide formyltransferase [Alteromonas stellipolaris]AMJ93886.1 phosphoribosylglycinamide formyltransferase [Alteromonas stellipolaris]MBZ2162938.1 phosphoribosylglycinamide formyltransferase [Alteromonas stellipolaris]MDO6535257.1 phosphoribosylglycinamide formyltransferase [Alteromonas stellipolaris]